MSNLAQYKLFIGKDKQNTLFGVTFSFNNNLLMNTFCFWIIVLWRMPWSGVCNWLHWWEEDGGISPGFQLVQVIQYRILHVKCTRTVFTHELWRIRNRTSERSERVRFLIQNNESVNTVQSTFHVVLCLLYTYWDWTPSLNYDKLYLNNCGQTTITESRQLRKKRKNSNKIQNLWNKVGLSEFKVV